jgi:hypothetical protein
VGRWVNVYFRMLMFLVGVSMGGSGLRLIGVGGGGYDYRLSGPDSSSCSNEILE